MAVLAGTLLIDTGGIVLVLVMGVCGVGKSAVGSRLAEALGVPFLEGDSFHPARNVEKMRGGSPLTDEDRAPWLHRIGDALRAHSGGGCVLACSALRKSYRDILRGGGDYRLVFLDGDRDMIAARMRERHDHYMPTTLLDSQIALLEPPGREEQALRVDVSPTTERIVDEILDWIDPEKRT